MTLRSDLRENRWLRAQFAVLIFAAAYLPVAGVLGLLTGSWWVLAPIPVYMSAGVATWVPSRRTDRALKAARAAAEREAAVLRTPRVPDASPDQCPVCAGYGLDALAKDDAFMERGALAKVVAWGSRRAHWDCAEWSPYVEPKQHFQPFETDGHMTYCACSQCTGKERGHRAYSRCTFCGFYQFGPSKDAAAEKLIAHVKVCTKRPKPIPASAFEVDGHPTYVGSPSAREDLRLAAGATAGSRTVLLGGVAPGTMFLIQDAALRHMEIVTVTELGGGNRSGYGVTARLAEPLRHSFPADTKLTPMDRKRLWNWTESRPYTRTELGLCDCGCGPTRDPMLAQYLALDSARFEAKLKSITDPESILRMLGKGF